MGVSQSDGSGTDRIERAGGSAPPAKTDVRRQGLANRNQAVPPIGRHGSGACRGLTLLPIVQLPGSQMLVWLAVNSNARKVGFVIDHYCLETHMPWHGPMQQ